MPETHIVNSWFSWKIWAPTSLSSYQKKNLPLLKDRDMILNSITQTRENEIPMFEKIWFLKGMKCHGLPCVHFYFCCCLFRLFTLGWEQLPHCLVVFSEVPLKKLLDRKVLLKNYKTHWQRHPAADDFTDKDQDKDLSKHHKTKIDIGD